MVFARGDEDVFRRPAGAARPPLQSLVGGVHHILHRVKKTVAPGEDLKYRQGTSDAPATGPAHNGIPSFHKIPARGSR